MADEELSPYELVVAGPVARAIAEHLPEGVASAVVELITGPLVENRHRLGRQLQGDLAGLRSAPRDVPGAVQDR